ncbi:TPA: hypothetical protein R6W46_004383 [Citrobacter freundii]|uniref:hypothetical protein n=1 Tax=Enterobacter sp. RHBSTW-00318 TaxID=2742643 RepID=UPI0015FA1CF4|nr:hypothetical protein [Enterobacter sp. RHBSTW-00318]HCL6635301.1 hypothetical protein [Citrobacter freundii]MBA7775966.1 hypothetical protein [Enterobacter sp. RHBSTW-00318]HCL6760318.1 hypothetical protein [Citrobacter freundii]HED2425093.1 hypothetical protein [Citrobacter freundii]HED3099568.1 hypothetical protein [Citrobacter freundii]
MDNFSSKIARISGMTNKEIIDLHFTMQEEIKKQYKLRANPKNLQNAISLCEKCVAISGIVIEAMKKKHRADCDEYARIFGRLSPNSKFYYPSHTAARQLCIILKKQGNANQIAYIEDKMAREGWGSGKSVDLLDL